MISHHDIASGVSVEKKLNSHHTRACRVTSKEVVSKISSLDRLWVPESPLVIEEPVSHHAVAGRVASKRILSESLNFDKTDVIVLGGKGVQGHAANVNGITTNSVVTLFPFKFLLKANDILGVERVNHPALTSKIDTKHSEAVTQHTVANGVTSLVVLHK